MNLLKCFMTFVILLVGMSQNLSAQNQTQTVRGTVVDKVSQSPIPMAKIILLNADSTKIVVSDESGKFTLLNVPVGNRAVKITSFGYKELILPNLTVNAGKELVLNINLEEDVTGLEEVTVKAKVEKNKPLNSMSTVSTRTFSVEETQKFAAAVNDPARMATAFAGVIQTGDGNNNISIRGNSPNGLLWRMEGVDIPNPNHFANVGTSGGGISILSAQLLSNSDFSTGAFAAEYGNALSGVFDVKLRKGNNQKREYTVQLGILGADLSAEGPFKKGYDGSYLVNYRYSTLNLLGKIGIPFGDANTKFQDLSFNLFLPTKQFGKFTVFGFGGLSSQITIPEKDSLRWQEDGFTQYNSKFYSNTGAIGITNTKLFKNQSNLKTALVFSGNANGYNEEKMQDDYVTLIRQYDQKYVQDKITFSSVYTQKLSAKSNVRTGLILNQLGYRLIQNDISENNQMEQILNVKGNTQTIQGFFQWNYKLASRLTTNVGLHYFQLLLNNSNSIEPRASLKFDITPKQHLTFGYGMHSQLQPIGVYFAQKPNEAGGYSTPNRNLGLSKAHHFVLGYDFILTEFSHIKTEVYYQYLFNVPISNDPTDTYSILNAQDGYYTDALTSKGLGRNYGLELTYERFLHKNLYYLLSGSLYESKYKAADGNWYDTRYNTNFALSLTIGKEWMLSEKRKGRIIGFNIKSVYVGGFRYTPIDLAASIEAGETKYITSQTFSQRMPDYYRLDIRFSLKRNYKKLTSILALDIQNTTNRQNVGGQYFEIKTGKINYWYQTGLLPILSYKIEF